MTSLFFSIIAAGMLSVTSLIVVLLRVSPLTSAGPALAAFFASVFLSVVSIATLLLFYMWRWFPLHTWDEGKILGIALRQGVFLALGTVILILFHLFGLLTWWIGVLIYMVFLLIEIALHS
ncbi:MAG TPA: hypothetical protein VI873_04200 [Candidatus Peribacteraceae bacterium]|nr:hypothetical protein [Candidatus Peribacteraceae bacterium]